MDRITITTLRRAVSALNIKIGFPGGDAWEKTDTGYRSIPGTFSLDAAYGGYALARMADGGGEYTIITRRSARELYDAIGALRYGMDINAAKH